MWTSLKVNLGEIQEQLRNKITDFSIEEKVWTKIERFEAESDLNFKV